MPRVFGIFEPARPTPSYTPRPRCSATTEDIPLDPGAGLCGVDGHAYDVVGRGRMHRRGNGQRGGYPHDARTGFFTELPLDLPMPQRYHGRCIRICGGSICLPIPPRSVKGRPIESVCLVKAAVVPACAVLPCGTRRTEGKRKKSATRAPIRVHVRLHADRHRDRPDNRGRARARQRIGRARSAVSRTASRNPASGIRVIHSRPRVGTRVSEVSGGITTGQRRAHLMRETPPR
jgi:hypothetical protein